MSNSSLIALSAAAAAGPAFCMRQLNNLGRQSFIMKEPQVACLHVLAKMWWAQKPKLATKEAKTCMLFRKQPF